MPFDSASAVKSDVLVALENARHRLRLPIMWCKDDLEKGPRVCMLGAIYAGVRRIVPPGPDQVALRMKVEKILQQALPGEWQGQEVADFNDEPLTKHKDVLAAFDRAIAEVEEKTHAV